MDQVAIVSGLKELGLKEGDVVLLHSSLSSLGRIEGGAERLVNAFLEVLGERGTLVVPTFCEGIVPRTVARHPRAVKSIAPSATVAAIGAKAEALCRDHWKADHAHTEGTPYARLAEAGGYVCLLGVDFDRCTVLHTAEETLRLPYLKDTDPKEIETPEGRIKTSWKLYPGPHRDFIGLDPYLRKSGKMRVHRIGNAVARLIKAQDLIDLAQELGQRDAHFVLCDNPNCGDCVAQRADLRRHRLKREDFVLATAGSLAGRYVPEMAENCRAAGIDVVELDAVQGKPVQAIAGKELAGHVQALRDEQITVAALRLSGLPEKLADLLAVAADSGIGRVVLPLTAAAGDQLAEAAEKGLTLSFYNLAHGSRAAGDVLKCLEQQGTRANFTFNGANFTRCGERPFLESYKAKLRRHVDQVDLEDCTFDGTPQRLACGNGEVKEMISILRCASFSGFFVLGALNRTVGSLRDAADRFMELLEHM